MQPHKEDLRQAARAVAVIRVEPLGRDLECQADESVLQAAERAGYCWPTICHGDGDCKICWFTIEQGADSFPPPDDFEAEQLRSTPATRLVTNKVVRLACQARPHGDAVVTKRGVKPPGDDDQHDVGTDVVSRKPKGVTT
jgi:2Fe-2S ferredoxin